MRVRSLLSTLGATLLLAACVTVNKSVLDRSHMDQVIPRDLVHVYMQGDSIPAHDRVAILSAKGDDDMTNESQLIDKLREEAGKLGANAIVLGEIKEPSTGARVAGAILGTPTERRGQAIAIYVPSLRRNLP